MNDELSLLIVQFAGLLASLTRRLQSNSIDVDTWHTEFLKLLAQYLGLALLQGANAEQLNQSQASIVANALTEQSRYLDNFAQEIRNEGWNDEYIDRAKMYADSLRQPYWEGATECLDLPILPASPRLDCDSFCKCFLEIRWLDKANCSADVYWHTTTREHSPDCTRLEREWNPLRVRNGSIVNE